MSNRKRQLNRVVTSIRRQSVAAQLGLAPEAWPYASVEVVHDPLVCDECGHLRLNATQASACCTMQGDDCPECAIRDDQSAEALAAAVVSGRAFAIRRAQEMADWTGESFAVWEAAGERFRTLRADEWPDGSEWGRIATVEP